LCALGSLLVTHEEELIVLRALQSLCSGILSVLLFVAVMATLPAGPRRAVGLTVFAFASTAPSALSAWVGAFLTERFGWQGLYYFDIAWDLALLLLAWRFLRPTPRAMRLSEIDWVGYVLVAIGLCALILFMKQGDRFFWLQSPAIRLAGIIAALVVPAAVLAL